jgi:hypothetical protein
MRWQDFELRFYPASAARGSWKITSSQLLVVSNGRPLAAEAVGQKRIQLFVLDFVK